VSQLGNGVKGEEAGQFGIDGLQRTGAWLASVILCRGFIGGAVSLVGRGGKGRVGAVVRQSVSFEWRSVLFWQVG